MNSLGATLGGGACADAASSRGFGTAYDATVTTNDDPALRGGLLALDDARNPFRDWSFVYIPEGEDLLRGLPHVARAELEQCGHLPQYTHPEVLCEVIERFLLPLAA